MKVIESRIKMQEQMNKFLHEKYGSKEAQSA